MNVSAEVFCVVCPIIELFESFQYEQGWVQWNAYVPIWLLSHTNTCIVPENSITVRRSWSDSRTSSNLFSCPARVLMLSATCFIILRHALTIVQLPEPWQKMRVFFGLPKSWLLQKPENPPFEFWIQREIIIQQTQTLQCPSTRSKKKKNQTTYQLLRKPPSLSSLVWHLSLTLTR